MRILGPLSASIYIALCRHSNNETQECFPSIALFSEECGVSKNTVLRSIKKLQGLNMINVQKMKKENGTHANNIYTLLSKEQWVKPSKMSPGPTGGPGSRSLPGTRGSAPQALGVVPPGIHNNTNNKKTNNINKTHGVAPSLKKVSSANLLKIYFEEFWVSYPPRRGSKKAALNKWISKIDEKLALTLIADVKRRKQEDDNWKNGFEPMVTTYLNQERWNDDIIKPRGGSAINTSEGTPRVEGKYKDDSKEINNK